MTRRGRRRSTPRRPPAACASTTARHSAATVRSSGCVQNRSPNATAAARAIPPLALTGARQPAYQTLGGSGCGCHTRDVSLQAKLVESDQKVADLTEQIRTLQMQKVSRWFGDWSRWLCRA
jgi:hypothetical protein